MFLSRAVARVLLLLVIATSAGTPTWSQVRWKNGETSATPTLSASEFDDVLAGLSQRGDRTRVVVYLDGPPDVAARAKLEANGVELLSYLGGHAYFASLTADLSARQTDGLDRIVAVEPISVRHKLHPDIAAGIVHPWSIVEATDEAAGDTSSAVPANPMVAAYVWFHPNVELRAEGAAVVEAHGGKVRSWVDSINVAVVHVRAEKLREIAAADAVMFVEPPLPQWKGLNDGNRARVGADTLQALPYGRDGSGIDVLIYDTGQIADHDDFGNRVTIGDDYEWEGEHSTHVAGTVGGDGTLSGGQYRGMAPAVEFLSYTSQQTLGQGFFYLDPGDLEADFTDGVATRGADIANVSLGTNTADNWFPCSWEGNYGAASALIDAMAAGSLGMPIPIVWSNGNERGDGRCGYGYLTTAPPACAKGHITVGALHSDDDTVTSFTSWGPCDDGRMKPDVSGPGCQKTGDEGVTSPTSWTDYVSWCGTSMSAPTVTGIGALLLQHSRATHPGAPDPRGATFKAILAQTAVDVANPGPDYQSGYGSVRAVPAAELIGDGRLLEEAVGQGETFEAFVSVGGADTELKVTVAWGDPPGTPNVATVLVNDLDLRVVGPDDAVYLPWTLDPENPGAGAVRTAPNRLDNIEQVRIDLPAAGIYRVRVHGTNVAQGPEQTFGLVGAPSLGSCVSQGLVSVGGSTVGCESTLDLALVDCDLNVAGGVQDLGTVSVSSDTEPAGETVMLVESGFDTGRFEGQLTVSGTDGSGVLHVSEGDTVSVSYLDADDGAGGNDVETTVDVMVDCTAPALTGISVTPIYSNQATVTVDLDEDARVTLRYGESCGVLDRVLQSWPATGSHQFVLVPLTNDLTYYYAVETIDTAGNGTTHDNGGICYEFTTLGPDLDNDGIPDVVDNCPARPNLDQADGDEDGLGDACDNCPSAPNPGQEDTEGLGSFFRREIDRELSGIPAYPPGDIDGDGDLDILAMHAQEDLYGWYENLDGAGNFGALRIIASEIDELGGLFLADVDGDEDLDVLATNYGNSEIFLHENVDGQGDFGSPQQVTPSGCCGSYPWLEIGDLDGDGDLDLMVESSTRAQWSENTDGLGTFGPAVTISNDARYASIADLDGDGDLDVVAFEHVDDLLAWHENLTGNGDFGPARVITSTAPYSASRHSVADFDGDTDLDVLVTAFHLNQIWLYENLDGAGNFSEGASIASLTDPTHMVWTDLDSDGDDDMFVSVWTVGPVWFEHIDGAGTYVQSIIQDVNRLPTPADLDSDGDVDLLTTAGTFPLLGIDWLQQGEDGAGDVCDNCPSADNDDQSDVDSDLLGDACDACTDTDGDNWGDPGYPATICPLDNCPSIANPDQLDTDGDLVGDLCDNCLLVANSDQMDQDMDGLGDLCEICPTVFNPLQEDPDSDGTPDACDNCPGLSNASQSDVDADQIGDHCDEDDGRIYVLFTADSMLDWQDEAISGFSSWSYYGGDLSVLKATGVYTQLPGSNPLAERECGLGESVWPVTQQPGPDETAFSLIAAKAGFFQIGLGADSEGQPRPSHNSCP